MLEGTMEVMRVRLPGSDRACCKRVPLSPSAGQNHVQPHLGLSTYYLCEHEKVS